MSNITLGSDPRDFYVWIDPQNFLVRHQISVTGEFFSIPAEKESHQLMFLPNPEFQSAISPFQNGLLKNYVAEYNLEISRQFFFSNYPCRLQAIFLFESKEDAEEYQKRHGWHVANRILKRVKSIGSYSYSTHDSSWVDFLRLGLMVDQEILKAISERYWNGSSVTDVPLEAMGKSWSQSRITEVLYLGRIEFYDRSLPSV